MGTAIEFNDTLKITADQGFPADILNLEKHQQAAIDVNEIKDRIFEFKKEGARVFHHSPTRCFLVQEINGKWLYWGHIAIIEQSITGDSTAKHFTSGKYKIVAIYDPQYQKQTTNNEARQGSSYFK